MFNHNTADAVDSFHAGKHIPTKLEQGPAMLCRNVDAIIEYTIGVERCTATETKSTVGFIVTVVIIATIIVKVRVRIDGRGQGHRA